MKVNILISSAGRRVGLMNCFRESLSELGISGRLVAVDATPYSAAAQLADVFYLVPRCTDQNFVPEVKQICEREEVHLVVPTIDTELPAYAEARHRFRKQGTEIAISSPETVAICYNKILTHEWLMSQGLPVPRQTTVSAVLADPEKWTFPLIIKPIDGSGSLGVRVVPSCSELAGLSNPDGVIVQELVGGAEHTINVFVNREGRCVCAVPHFRMEVRGGEVSKGTTAKNLEMMELANRVVERLPGAYGALNVQCFATPANELKIIEMNARFGGGYPLAHRSGAHITRWLIEEILGREPHRRFDGWEDGLTMLRYDEAVFVPRNSLETFDVVTDDRRRFSPHPSAKRSARLIRPDSPEWDEFLTLVPHDFFQTAKYHAFSAGLETEAWLVVHGSRDKFVAWPYLLQSVGGQGDPKLPLRDVTSVYGYSGPIAHNCIHDEEFLAGAWESALEVWRSQSVVSVFTRFHPILGNQACLRGRIVPGVSGQVYKEGKTVVIDLSKSPDDVWADYHRKLRQQIRRIEREQEFTSVYDPEWNYLDDFISIYRATLERNNAAPFYFFSRNYFMGLKETLGSHGGLLVCKWRDTVIAALLLIEYNGIVSVHLAASVDRFSTYSPNKWLFHSAQALAREQGHKFLHIGGGRGSRDDDPLFRFKSMFSSTHMPFYTGRWILDANAYEFLTVKRETEAKLLGNGHLAATYFPQYRAPFIKPGPARHEPGPLEPVTVPAEHDN